MAIKKNGKEILEQEDALVLLGKKWEPTIPLIVRQKCEMIFLMRFKKHGFRREMYQSSGVYAKRIALLLTGLVESGKIQESDISPLRTEEDILSFIREKLGFTVFAMILQKDKDKRKYIEQSTQMVNWRILNNFSVDPSNKHNIKSAAEYVAAYKKLLLSIKARISLAEIIDKNVSEADRGKFFILDKNNESHLWIRAVFCRIATMSYENIHGKLETLESYKAFKDYCADGNQIPEDVKNVLIGTIESEIIRNAIIELPEMLEYLGKLRTIAQNGTFRKFTSFLGSNTNSRALSDEVGRFTAMIGRWTHCYEIQSANPPKTEQTDTPILPILSKVMNSLPEKTFLYLLKHYPYLAVFFNVNDTIHYIIAEPDVDNRGRAFAFIEDDIKNKANEILNGTGTLLEFINKYRTNSDIGGGLTIKKDVMDFFSDWDSSIATRVDDERMCHRSKQMILHALTELSMDKAIELILRISRGGQDVNKALPESYRSYLWYKDRGKSYGINIDSPSEYIAYVQEEDVQRYLQHKRLFDNGTATATALVVDGEGKDVGDDFTDFTDTETAESQNMQN